MQNKITKRFQLYFSFILGHFFFEKKDYMTQKHFHEGKRRKKKMEEEEGKDKYKIE